MSEFIVVIEGYFIRDAQVFCPKDLEIPRNEEYSDEICDRYEKDNDWADLSHPDVYLGVYTWDSSDVTGLLEYIGNKHGYPAGIIRAYKI